MSPAGQSRLRRWWWRQQFEPGWAAMILSPFYFARRGLVGELRAFLPALEGTVIDVGCGRKPYRALIPATRYVGLDLDSPTTRELGVADVFYDGQALPFPDASFDGALCSQVLEHVATPEEFLRDIARVVRPGGTLVLTVPFVWDEHEQPYDFQRYSSFGLRSLLQRTGFEVVTQRKSCADFRAVVQLASAFLFKTTHTRLRVLNLLVQLVLIAPVNALGGVVALLLPGNPDLYLDNVVLARRIGPSR